MTKKSEKLIICLLVIILIAVNLFIYVLIKKIDEVKAVEAKKDDYVISSNSTDSLIKDLKEYKVYQNDNLINSFDSMSTAIEYAEHFENTSVKKDYGAVLWSNHPIFDLYDYNSEYTKSFSSFEKAVSHASEFEKAYLFSRSSQKNIWNNYEYIPSKHIIHNVPLISQYPELYRGCEVTSLAMLLQYKGHNVNKFSLAEEISKDSTPYTVQNDIIYFGNPNLGFVGDIYNKSNKGLGAYHRPIFELMSNYVGSEALDITGCNESDIYFYVSRNKPVWVIINTTFKHLPDESFENWVTPEGIIEITYREHSVLVVGYDNSYIYFNDPMYPTGMRKAKKQDFIAAWNQMGKQAVTYY